MFRIHVSKFEKSTEKKFKKRQNKTKSVTLWKHWTKNLFFFAQKFLVLVDWKIFFFFSFLRSFAARTLTLTDLWTRDRVKKTPRTPAPVIYNLGRRTKGPSGTFVADRGNSVGHVMEEPPPTLPLTLLSKLWREERKKKTDITNQWAVECAFFFFLT